MLSKITIVNAFDPEDYFIEFLSREYDNAVSESGVMSELLFINPMHFSYTPFPEHYTFDTLEPDLQRSIQSIKDASVVSIFTSWNPHKEPNPAITHFVNRLFHLQHGAINTGIWGDTNTHHKRVRIITVIDDPAEWRRYKRTRDPGALPVTKIDFRLFGFGEVFTKTFGYLKPGELNDYGRKCVETIHFLAAKDAEALGLGPVL